MSFLYMIKFIKPGMFKIKIHQTKHKYNTKSIIYVSNYKPFCRVQNSAYKSITCMPYIKKQTKERHSKTTTTSSSGFKPKFPTSLHLHRGSLTTQLLNPKNKNNYDFIQVD
jgi:hypothetical protein